MTVLPNCRLFEVCSIEDAISVRCASYNYEVRRSVNPINGLGETYPSRLGVSEITFIASIVLAASEFPPSFTPKGCKVTLDGVTYYGGLVGYEGNYRFEGRTLGMEGYVDITKEFNLTMPPDIKAPWAGGGWL